MTLACRGRRVRRRRAGGDAAAVTHGRAVTSAADIGLPLAAGSGVAGERGHAPGRVLARVKGGCGACGSTPICSFIGPSTAG